MKSKVLCQELTPRRLQSSSVPSRRRIDVVVKKKLLNSMTGLLLLLAVAAQDKAPTTQPRAEMKAAGTPAETIRSMLMVLYENGQFNGSILIATNGVVVYRDAFGSAASSSIKNRPETPSNLASVSKQFTAMAVMMLVERDKMGYEDLITKYLPELVDSSKEITIRHLLTHTSGIPDVGDLEIDRPNLRESEVMKAIVEKHTHFGSPGGKYRYSNTGYKLLGMIVERVAGMSLADFLARNIFDPLGMPSTRLSTRPGGTKGDGGIFSTVDDLLKWDQALYSNRLVKQEALKAAFTPASVREGTTTYGFGWNSAERDGDRFVWHTGNTGEYRAFIGRRLGEKVLVVILTNRGDSRRPEICEAILDILHNKPYRMPKLSVTSALIDAIQKLGVEAGIQEYHRLKTTQPEKFDFSESVLNSLGYQLLGEGEKEAAVRIFESNTREFPESSNTYDSLGEAYKKIGQKERAIQ